MPQHAPLTPEEFQTVYQRAIKQAPADLSQAEFDDYVAQQAQHEEAAKAGSVAPGASEGLSFSPSGIFGGFLKGAKGLATGIGDLLTTDPRTTISNAVSNQVGQFGKAAADFGRGRYSEAIGHGAAGLLPLMGPAAADLGERTAESGDVGNALGEGSLMALLASPSAMKPALAKAASAVPVAGRGLSAAGRGVEAAGKFTAGETSRLGGFGSIMHGDPFTGAAILAGPKAAELTGRGMQRVGNSMASLTGDPSEWISRSSSTPTHADLNAWGAKQYTAGRAQQDAASRASGVAEDFRLPARKFGDVDTSWDTDFMQHGGEAPSHTPGVPQPSVPRNKFVTSQDVSPISDADFQRYTAKTPDRMARANARQPTFEGAASPFNDAMARAVEQSQTPAASMESLMDLPASWQQFAGPEAEMAMVRRNQTGRW